MNFTIEEVNMIAIYNTGKRIETISSLRDAIPFITDKDLQMIGESAMKKLVNMSDEEFYETAFDAIEPDDENEQTE